MRTIIFLLMSLVIPINVFALLFGGAVLGLVLIRGVTNLLLQDCVVIVVVIIVVVIIVFVIIVVVIIVVVIIVAVITISILSTSVMLNRKVVP